MEWRINGFEISDDKGRVDTDYVHGQLTQTYWAADRTREAVEETMRASLCFGMYGGGRQIGFARAAPDGAALFWICDVIIDPAYRGRGLGAWLMECVVSHPHVQDTELALRTKDAARFYEPFGFRLDRVADGFIWMRRLP